MLAFQSHDDMIYLFHSNFFHVGVSLYENALHCADKQP